jgi:non-canonical purine NTP pyrophosphatase (RdgB/HAM1 family)
MKGINVENRTAVFRSVFAYVKSNFKPLLFVGECKGIISFQKSGSKGFGYDPIFIPQNTDETFAEMSIDKKNSYSHRGKSLDKLIHFFKKYK